MHTQSQSYSIHLNPLQSHAIPITWYPVLPLEAAEPALSAAAEDAAAPEAPSISFNFPFIVFQCFPKFSNIFQYFSYFSIFFHFIDGYRGYMGMVGPCEPMCDPCLSRSLSSMPPALQLMVLLAKRYQTATG